MTDATTPEQTALERAANEGRNVLSDATDDQATVIEQWALAAIEAQARPAVASEGLRAALDSIALEVYSGLERPPSDAGQLLAIADWLDRIDDKTDAATTLAGKDHRVTREVQADLRRIAAALASDAGSVGALGWEAVNLSQRITDAVNAGERPVSDMDFASILHGYAHQVADDRDDATDAERQGE